MTPRSRQAFGVLALVLVLAGGYVLKFGLYPRYFDIEWDEAVQLHDGRVIVVHVKRTYERLGKFERWRGVHRDSEISFDAGGTIGQFKKKFQRYDVSLIEQKNDQWFITLTQTTGTPPIKWIDRDAPFLILEPNGTLRKEIYAKFPAEFLRYNVMPDSPDPQGILQFNGTVLTQVRKMEHWRNFSTGAGDDGVIRRRNLTNLGEQK